ncbi:DUF5722 domain-containing protein [Microbacterium saperdae]|uniref:DUF5722 domain-containing protein n=1 Tax=Microbacterium saperdae TaxID=69368 RepID=A0A543BJ15_9MICO|nr:DUF5722 domain-containing protein [Microbacterium saperdae]TQL84753.1 hypothetical protein FB560_0345 [Microbacterium saperdae]GGM64318.1 hypothetical protein GCM10010489_39950 [Microbacterium saperdae]
MSTPTRRAVRRTALSFLAIFGLAAASISVVAVAPAPVAAATTTASQSTLLYGFDDGTTQGWAAGTNVDSVAAVTSFLNTPGTPLVGSHALQAIAAGVAANAPRVIGVAPSTPLDLSTAAELSVAVNSFGGAPSATGYGVTVTVRSGASTVVGTATGFTPDRWNRIVVDVSAWAGRSSVTGIDVSFAAVGSSTPWGMRYQIDDVAWSAASGGTVIPAVTTRGVTSVAADDSQIHIAGTVGASQSVQLRAVAPTTEVITATSGTAVGSTTANSAGSFSASVARTPIDGLDPLYLRFIAVVGGEVVGTYRHVDDFAMTPSSSRPYPVAVNKKGLQVHLSDDAEELGVQHAAINIDLTEIMLAAAGPTADTIVFTSGGIDYYFDRAAVAAMDVQIKPLSDNESIVNLIILAGDARTRPESAQVLMHPDAVLGAGGGVLPGFNTVTADGVRHLTAAMEFVAQRWSGADLSHGRVSGFIIGNEIDTPWSYYNSGHLTIAEFVPEYERALRIADAATAAASDTTRVYTSMDPAWVQPLGGGPTKSYAGKDVLTALTTQTTQHGDYDWNVAHHPYPENIGDPAFWDDVQATADIDTSPLITLKNIELLPTYLSRTPFTFDGAQRRVILSEQGCDTPGGDLAGEQLQAACYALAYYKVKFSDGIDNFILHRHVDHMFEGGFRLGLWTWDEDRYDNGGSANEPNQQKVIYEVFRDIDTERSLQVTDFAKAIIGISDWSELVPGFDASELADRPLPVTVGAATTGAPSTGTTVLSDFATGVDGWRASDYSSGVVNASGALAVSFTANAKVWRGTDVVWGQAVDASAASSLWLRVRTSAADVPLAGAPTVKVKLYGADGTIAEGTTAISATGQWTDVELDIDGWTGRSSIERIKVWVKGTTNVTWTGTFEIDDVGIG